MVRRLCYRCANGNTPAFESAFTTGGTGFKNPGGACPDLRPFQKTGEEKLTDGEVGAKTDFRLGNGRGRFNIAAFYTSYKNALQFLNAPNVCPPFRTTDPPPNGSLADNIAALELWGLKPTRSGSPVREVQ